MTTTHITTLNGEKIALADIEQADPYLSDDMWLALTKDGKCHSITEEDFVTASRHLGKPEDEIDEGRMGSRRTA